MYAVTKNVILHRKNIYVYVIKEHTNEYST